MFSSGNYGQPRSGHDIYENGYSIYTKKRADENESKLVNQVRKVFYELTVNSRSHGTDDYEIADLVVRRGQDFQIVLELDRPYDEKRDNIILKFEIGDKDDKNVIEMDISAHKYRHDWAVNIFRLQGQNIRLQIFTPPDCIVGRWKLNVSSIMRTEFRTAEYRYKDKDNKLIYMLFNPWCKDDLVYFPWSHLAEYYVLEEDARIYKGSKDNSYSGLDWIFGQFEKDVLECAMYLLEKSDLKVNDRGDPVKVGRKLSALANAPDNNGVLVGNWSGNYSGGTPPWNWTGSAEILSTYYETKTPVKYGQCWVFSGILTTLCRTLGIPARSVTCYDSAHDTDGNMTIDKFVNSNDEIISKKNKDSVWNFHVWNDIWTKRPDLGSMYDGWQALDSTPQEKSDGIYRCGPAPVYAVKNRKTNILYDTPFVYAEVNGDIVYRDERTEKILFVETKGVGTKIITAYPSEDNIYQDITNEYKYPEHSAGISEIEKPPETELNKRLKIEFEDKKCMYGDPFETTLRVLNNTGGRRTLRGEIKISSISPTGKPGHFIRAFTTNIAIPYGTEKEFTISVEVAEYLDKLLEECFLEVQGIFFVPETGNKYPIQKRFILRKPQLKMMAPRVVTAGDGAFDLELSFKSPLNRRLTDCSLALESPRLFRAAHFEVGHVPPNEVYRVKFKIPTGRPSLKQRKISAVFNSNEMFEVRGFCKVLIQRY